MKLADQLKESAKRILSVYLKEVDTIPEICDKVYAMGRAIGIKLGKLVEVNPNLYGGGANLPPREFFCYSSETVGARLLKLCGFYC